MGRISESEYRVSHSEIVTFKRCRRKWYLQYYMRYRRKTRQVRIARETGIIVHGALHEYYKAGGDEDAAINWITAQRDNDVPLAETYERDDLVQSFRLAAAIVDGYFDWLAETGADSDLTITGSELSLTAPGPIEGVTLFGNLDIVAEHADGAAVVMDTKVVASIDEMVRSLHINEQALMYALLVKVNDPDPDRPFRVVWSMLKKTLRTAKAKPPFYDRYELVISPGQLEVFYEQLQGVIGQILVLEDLLDEGRPPNAVAYPTPTKDCSWDCEYYHVCPAMNDPNADPSWMLATYFERKEGKPTLGDTVAEVETTPVEVTVK